MQPFAGKSSSFGMTVAVPNVCLTPAPTTMVPIPYPNFATTALAKQKAAAQPTATKQAVTSKVMPRQGFPTTTMAGSTPQFVGAAKAKITGEVAQLVGELDRLHNNIRLLPATDPNAWQTALQQYVVAASALYVTKRDD
jgi:hypothetical protein